LKHVAVNQAPAIEKFEQKFWCIWVPKFVLKKLIEHLITEKEQENLVIFPGSFLQILPWVW